DGEGRPGIIGVKAAAPVMFDVFNRLKLGKKFSKPEGNWTEVKTCKESGYLVGPNCNTYIRQEIPSTAENAEVCPYHQKIHLDETSGYRVNSDCYPVSDIQSINWFVLPAIEGYYYQKIHPEYKSLPMYLQGCAGEDSQKPFDFIYPKNFTKIYL